MSWVYKISPIVSEKIGRETFRWKRDSIVRKIREIAELDNPRSMGGKPRFNSAPWAYTLVSGYPLIVAVIDDENSTVYLTDIVNK